VNECKLEESVCEKDENCVNTYGGFRCKSICETAEEAPCKNDGTVLVLNDDILVVWRDCLLDAMPVVGVSCFMFFVRFEALSHAF
jgi:hypothetical protein